jgi:hypothetical protein
LCVSAERLSSPFASVLKLEVLLEVLALLVVLPGSSESRDLIRSPPPRISLRISSSGFEADFVIAVEIGRKDFFC